MLDEEKMTTITTTYRSSRRTWRSMRCCLMPTIVLILLSFLLIWKPQLAQKATERFPALSNLPTFGGSSKNNGYSNWNDKGGRAGLFQSDAATTEWGSDAAKQWWGEYSKTIMAGKPYFEEIRFADEAGNRPMIAYESTTPWSERDQRLKMSSEEIEEMSEKHKRTLEHISSLAPKMPYVPGTRGIVVTTAVDAMAFLTVSLRMLRRTGTTLPVEIWMYDRAQWNVDPWGLRMCEEVWGPLGATCRFVEDHIPEHKPPPYDKPTVKYMNKMDAMMFSSFEQIIFMDSDNNAIMPLDNLFNTEPFKSHGMVLWPDYWKDWASPYFYKITGAEEPSVREQASTESGQIMINKRTHATALLMASYYGRYQQHYIRLLEQDLGSEGDKETFLRAAKVSGLSVYQVSQQPDRLGYRCDKSQRPVASGQHHPEDDFYLYQQDIRRGHTGDLLNDGTKPRIMFIHGNLPKYDPAAYLRWGFKDTWEDQLRCSNGKGAAHRMWGSRSLTLLKHGWDVEKALWDQMLWVSCQTEYLQVQWWTGTWNRNWTKIEHVCEDFGAFYDELLGSKGEGLKYNSALGPSPFDDDGEFTLRTKKRQGSLWDEMITEWRKGGNV